MDIIQRHDIIIHVNDALSS